MRAMNEMSFAQALKAKARRPLSLLVFLAVWAAMIITVFILVTIIIVICIKGIPNLKPSLFALQYNSENVSTFPAIISTIYMVLLTLLIAGPLGIFTAIYLVEYARRGNKLVKVIRITAETLSGIPSIVYGLFGMILFVTDLKMGFSLLAGSLTLVIMILPLLIRSTEEAIKSVPDTFREGSFGLGAGKLRTVFRIVLPSAIPGILAGVILSIGRIVGETAALLYTAGSVAQIPDNLFSSTRTLAIHMYALSKEGLHTNEAYGTAVVLLLTVLFINMSASAIAKRLNKINGGGT